MKGEEQRFADAGVRDMIRRALLPWYNAFSFLEDLRRDRRLEAVTRS